MTPETNAALSNRYFRLSGRVLEKTVSVHDLTFNEKRMVAVALLRRGLTTQEVAAKFYTTTRVIAGWERKVEQS